ncbi:MAG TPA: hypothetical protein DCQ98_14120 [Planctomycetaceae bacterium]|nr:hypothetical protein [Planctomycetaceae bacterium]HRF02064.1 hypothetical protein [Pirellulaceae bacterium]
MTPSRESLEQHWHRLGIEAGEYVGTALLLADAHLVGRRFRWERAQATWFADEGEAKLFDDDGHLVARLVVSSGEGRITERRHAA